MSNLGPQQQNQSFSGLLQIPGGVTSTLQPVLDGNGNPTGLSLSSIGSSVTTSSTFTASKNGSPFSGATPRLISDGFGDYLSVKDFGAKGDGTTDDTVAINNAIASAASNVRKVFFPTGIYILTSPLVITAPVTFVGEGSGYNGYAGSTNPVGTIIRYNGAAGAVVITYQAIQYAGFGLRDITIDCNNVANSGVFLNKSSNGYFSDFCVLNYKVYGLKLWGGDGLNSDWNTFISTNLQVNPTTNSTEKAAIWLSSSSDGYAGNPAHNAFFRTTIQQGYNGNGIVLGGCDNNTFYNTYIYAPSTSTGYGVLCDPSECLGFPGNNTFWHLQAGKGWYQPSTTIHQTGTVYNYCQDNGEPKPITNGTRFVCYYDSGSIQTIPGTSFGYSLGNNFTSNFSIPSGVTSYDVAFSFGNEPDNHYAPFVTFEATFPPTYMISNKRTNGFTIYFQSPTSNIIFGNFVIFRQV